MSGAEAREFTGDADHMHLLARNPPAVAVSALLDSLKEASAGRLRSEFVGRMNRRIVHGLFWSPSYFAPS